MQHFFYIDVWKNLNRIHTNLFYKCVSKVKQSMKTQLQDLCSTNLWTPINLTDQLWTDNKERTNYEHPSFYTVEIVKLTLYALKPGMNLAKKHPIIQHKPNTHHRYIQEQPTKNSKDCTIKELKFETQNRNMSHLPTEQSINTKPLLDQRIWRGTRIWRLISR